MPQNFRDDIEYLQARIAFYRQALVETEADNDLPDRQERIIHLKRIITNLTRTSRDLTKAVAQRTGQVAR